MGRTTICLLALVALARAGGEDDTAAILAMKEYHMCLTGAGGSIERVRDLCIAHLKKMSPKTAKSVRRQLDRGFSPKYKKDLDFHRCLVQALAAGGKAGIGKLFQRYKASMKYDGLRVAIAEELGKCNDEDALSTLLKIVHDKTPEVAAAAVTSCGAYAKVDEKKRKDAVKQLVKLFSKTTDNAAGKDAESTQVKMYKAMKPAMNQTLAAFTGQKLDSAQAWTAWLAENISKKWSK